MPESNLCKLRGKKLAKPSIINDKTIYGLHARGCAHANFGERAAGRIMRECRKVDDAELSHDEVSSPGNQEIMSQR